MPKRTFTIVFLCLVLVLGGCSSPTEDPASNGTDADGQTDPAPDDAVTTDPNALLIRVNGSGTYTITVNTVADDNNGVRVYHTDGSSVPYSDVQSRDDLPADALDGASRVEPLVDAPGVSFTTSNGSGGTFSWPAESSTLVYSVTDGEGQLLRWDYVSCSEGDILDLTIDLSESEDVSVGRSCTG